MEKIMITPEREQEYRETIKTMCYLDDDFFNACLQDHPEAALLILRIVMRKPDLVFSEKPQTQKVMKDLGHKSIRFDLFCVSENKYYDVEIQRRDKGAGAHRARYYSSLMDANITVSGEEYDQIPDTYVIFITEKDVMGVGRPFYTIDRKVEELDNRNFDDGSHILYVNGAYEGDDEFGRLMHDFRCTDPHKIYHKELREPAIFFKENEKGVEQMCEAIERIANERSNERAENIAIKLIRVGQMTDAEIADACGLTEDQVKELRNQTMAMV